MINIIEELQEEHRNIEKLLCVLEQELKVFQRCDKPDYELLQDIISYFQAYPERYHHPKEDLIFEPLKLRNPCMADAIADIESEHHKEADRLRRFALIVESIQIDHEILRDTFAGAVRDFINYQRKHIEKEERILFPAALNTLRPEDWEAINARTSSGKDPLFDSSAAEEFCGLRQRIEQWEEDNQAQRGCT